MRPTTSSVRRRLSAGVRPGLRAALVGRDLAIVDALLVAPLVAEPFLAGANRTDGLGDCGLCGGIAARGRLRVSNAREQREREGRGERGSWCVRTHLFAAGMIFSEPGPAATRFRATLRDRV